MARRKSSRSSTVRYAVIPAAGRGTRLLPVTEAIPKELIPIGNKPMIQYVLERLIEAGIREAVVVINPLKMALKKYLRKEFSKKIKLRFVVQKEPVGLDKDRFEQPNGSVVEKSTPQNPVIMKRRCLERCEGLL